VRLTVLYMLSTRPVVTAHDADRDGTLPRAATSSIPQPIYVSHLTGCMLMLANGSLGECLGNKTFLISLAGHGHVEDHRCDTLRRQTAFVGGDTKLSAKTWGGPGYALIASVLYQGLDRPHCEPDCGSLYTSHLQGMT
jgi:hypothetical protein